MSLFDWLNVGGQVVDLASNIASLFGDDETEDGSSNYDLGALMFGADGSGQLWAGNQNDQDMQMTMCMTTQQQGVVPSTTTQPILVPANAGVNITSAVKNFQSGGTFTITPVAAPDADTLTQALSFAVRSLAIGATISIIGGVSGSFGRNADGTWNFSVRSTGPQLTGGKVTVTDQNNVSATASVTFQNRTRQTEYDGSALLPAGLSLAPTIADVELELEMPPSDFCKLFFNDSVPLKDIPIFNRKRSRA